MISIEDLSQISQAEREAKDAVPHQIDVCVAASCLSLQSDKVKEELEKAVEAKGKKDCCKVRGVGCMGLCAAGPLVALEKEKVLYQGVKPEDAPAIVDALGAEPVARIQGDLDAPFFARQQKIVLENSGRIDPERVEEYVAADGYLALIDTLTAMTPIGVVQQITRSGLRGRGGAGYPTGLKWATVAKAQGTRKFVICNGDEGDPGAFMDRAVLESDPHRILEGMALAGYAVGAQQGYIYVRAEYPLAIKRLKLAIKQAEKLGVLGANIGGTTFSFNVDIRLGAGAFVCGEETALIASVEGGRGTPRPRPPYPAESGLWGYPTLINNVETLANIPAILRHGPEWFAKIGTGKSKGTKVFALAGAIANTGLIEVPMGMPLREIIFEIGGGVPDGKAFKAVQTGGPSGGCIPESGLDMPCDYESLAKLGSIMGSGGMIVMDETSSMVDVAKFFMEFCMDESCGKCVPCRVGTAQMHELLRQISAGEGTSRELTLLENLCEVVKATSLCGLGQSAPNPVLSTLHYFRHEYEAKIAAGEAAAAGHAAPAGGGA
jgi:bidirectional [NiFe] hydrogenase diaphorase subunit